MEADFGGWATKAGIKCSDGRIIMPTTFQHMDKAQVPLVWQHGHNDPTNVLGHAILEHREEGVYVYGFFNGTKQGNNAKELVQHKDIKSLSIYANQLVEKNKSVIHGMIREVSLVLAGANPGALIDYVRVIHADDEVEIMDDEAVIHTGLDLEPNGSSDDDKSDDSKSDDDKSDDSKSDDDKSDDSKSDDDLSHAANMTVQDVYDSMTTEQKNVLHYMIGVVLDNPDMKNAMHNDGTSDDDLNHKEGDKVSRNVFDRTDADGGKDVEKHELSHAAMQGIVESAQKMGSLKEAVHAYALQHGITNIDVLFPDAKAATGVIELDKRRTEWVSSVLNGTRKTPFARIKTFAADLTQDEARAKGYIKGTYKLEEWFGVSKRTTSPTTIYKKQKLDRDDMLDITDFDIVAFLKGEMRLMTEEEIARAVLIGDGRQVSDTDKIKDPLGASDGAGVRSILNDHELFVTTAFVNVDDASSSYEEVVDAVMDAMEFYKGTGTPTFYTTVPQLNKFLKARDGQNRRFYNNRQEVADALGVKEIILVEPMKEIAGLVGIIVNLDDYNVGTDRGGEITMFDDFDIDYNQQKYLMETRLSGALVKPKSAIVIKKTAAANVLAVPTEPAFVSSTGVVTIPTVTGVVYKGNDGTTTLTAGAQTALSAGASTTVYAVPASGYYFATTAEDSWFFKRPA